MQTYLLFSAIIFTIFGSAMLREVTSQFDHWLNLVIPIVLIAVGIWGFVCLYQVQAA